MVYLSNKKMIYNIENYYNKFKKQFFTYFLANFYLIINANKIKQIKLFNLF